MSSSRCATPLSNTSPTISVPFPDQRMPQPTSKHSIKHRSIPANLLLLSLYTLVWATVAHCTPAQSLSSRAAARAQEPPTRPSPSPQAIPACSVYHTCITNPINPIFATAMQCDGITDDSSALQTSLNSARATVGNVA